MKKTIEMSLGTARSLYKDLEKSNGAANQSLKTWLLENFTKEELEKGSVVDDMYKAWTNFLNDHGVELAKLPWDKEQCENDDIKAGDNAFHMLQHVVQAANKLAPKTDKYWIPVFNNDDSGFFFSRRSWRSGSVSDVCFRLRYNNQELCERYVKKYEPIYKVYQYQ